MDSELKIAVIDVADPAGGLSRLIELQRPEKLNCLSLQMLDDLWSALTAGKVSRLILAGAGRAFCSGLDLNEVASTGGKLHLQRLVRIYRWLLKTPLPTLALARGYAAGGGAGLALCARTVVVSTDFRFVLPGGKLAGLAAVVVPLCNLRTSSKPTGDAGWLGSELDAAQATRLGLVDRVVLPETLSAAVEKARNGTIAPELFEPPPRDAQAVDCALAHLDQFLQTWE